MKSVVETCKAICSTNMYIMQDAIIVSDFHLGSKVCNCKLILQFLDMIDDGTLATKELILNGDIFDSWDFRRLTKKHWKILSWLRKRSDQMTITWILGNHDSPGEIFSHLLGLDIADTYILHSGDERILVMHGHQFDGFLDAHPIITWFCDTFYFWLQKIDKSISIARRLKKASKSFLRCSEAIQEKALEYAKKKQCGIVVCGHTHMEVEAINQYPKYYNSGTWTEGHGAYLTVKDGKVELKIFAGN